MKNFKILYCRDNCGISDENIKDLDLRELYVTGNLKIKNIGHMKNLKILHCAWDSGITDEDIRDLDLIVLSAYDNSKVTIKIDASLSTSHNDNYKRK